MRNKKSKSYSNVTFVPFTDERLKSLLNGEIRGAVSKLLPKSYLKGGTARNLLMVYLLTTEDYFPALKRSRDFDVIYTGRDSDRVEDHYEKLGWDFEYVRSVPSHMKRTDVGMNQALLGRDGLYYTEKSRRDIQKNKVTVTPYEYREDYEEMGYETPIGSRVILRAITFALRTNASFPKKYLDFLKDDHPNDFNQYLALFKCFETGVQDDFFEILKKTLRLSQSSAEEYLLYLSTQVTDFNLTPKQEKILQDARELVAIDRYETEFGNNSRRATTIKTILTNTSDKIISKSQGLKPRQLKSKKPKKQLFTYSVPSGKDVYTVKVKILNPKTLDCQVKCDCKAWVYQGGEYYAKTHSYIYGVPVGTATKPTKRDPKGENWVCKHIASVLNSMGEKQLSKMASRIASVYLLQ